MNRHALFATAVALLSSGCEALEPFTPKVTFDRLDINELDFQHADVDFVFAVDNPNPVQIGLATLTYDLALEEQPFLSGDDLDGITLAANGSSDLPLPVDVVFGELIDTLDATRGEDVVDFQLSGKMGFDTPAGKVDLPYSEGGGFPALRTPTFRFQGVRIPKVDFTSADIEVDLGVDNPQGSTLFFDRFDYNLRLGDTDVVDGLVSTFAVEAGQEGTLTLPFSVSLLSVGEVVLAAIAGEPLPLGIDANMDVDTPFGVVPLSIDETGNLQVQ